MGRAIVAGGSKGMTVPIVGTPLSEVAEGSIVKLNENGSLVEFYVAKHDYEPTLNGTGRTLLVRKDCYDQRAWNGSAVNAWENCDLRSWLNGEYLNLFDVDTRASIGATMYYYTPGNGTTSVATRSDAVFQVSTIELGRRSASAMNTEGTELPIASTLRIVYLNGAIVAQWTRTPCTSTTTEAWMIETNGGNVVYRCTNIYGSRPCFTLPSNAVFDTNTLLFKGVS